MLIYKTSDGIYQIDNKILPVGSCGLEIYGTQITIRSMVTRIAYVDMVDITTIDSATNGTKYTTVASFLTAMKGFFHPSLDVV